VKSGMSKHLWNGMRELMQLSEFAQMPDIMQAHIASIILKAQTFIDLDNDYRAKRLAQVNKK
jgi:hypothetical protein